MDDAALITAAGVRHTYRTGFRRRTVAALLGVDLAVAPGEVVALLGPNGSGKSTLIHNLLGVLRPDAGRIATLGLPPGHPEALRRIGFLPEKDPPWGRLTGRDALLFTARLHGLDRTTAARRSGELLAELGLEGAADRAARGYSKGMARRLGLACALVHRPALLILDEPTSGLDPLGSGLVLDRLHRLVAEGTAILLSSHHFHEVEALAHRVVVLHAGRVAAAGPREAILADPDRWQLTVGGLDAQGREQLHRLADRLGRVEATGPALLGLEAVLRRSMESTDTGEEG